MIEGPSPFAIQGQDLASSIGVVPRITSLLVKPASAVCNLDCAYCFYLDREADPYKALPARRMTLETLERLVDTYLFYSYPNSTFAFQGGEPTLAGLCFFEKLIDFQKEHGRGGQNVSNALQTGRMPQGAVCPHPISHIDVTPTILDALGLPVPKPLEGKSMLTTFRNPAVRPNPSVFLEWGRYEVDHDGFGGFQPIRAAFDGRYKLTINLLTSDELYDLQNDSGEMVNLIESLEHATARDRLHDSIIAWMHRTRDPFRGYYWGRRSWRPDYPVAWAGLGMTRQREDDGYEPRQLVYETGLEMKEAIRKK